MSLLPSRMRNEKLEIRRFAVLPGALAAVDGCDQQSYDLIGSFLRLSGTCFTHSSYLASTRGSPL
jgi:hypothetical protein